MKTCETEKRNTEKITAVQQRPLKIQIHTKGLNVFYTPIASSVFLFLFTNCKMKMFKALLHFSFPK